MTKLLSALMLVLSMAVFGAPVASALETSPSAFNQVGTQDGDKGKQKHGKKKKHKKGKKKQAKRAAKKAPKKQNRKKGKK